MEKLKELLYQEEIHASQLEGLLELREKKEADFLLIDVREEYEYRNSRILGVDYLIPMSEFFDKVKSIEPYKSKTLILQCKSGGRSMQAKRQLDLMGFNKTINLAGGISVYNGAKEQG